LTGTSVVHLELLDCPFVAT